MSVDNPWLVAVRAVVAIVLGYGLIVLLTIAGFVGWLRDANLYLGGPAMMAKGLLVAVVSGLAGGYAAALVGGRRPLLHAALVLLPLAADSYSVFFVLPRETPLWFEVIGSATLMSVTVGGGLLRALQRKGAAGAEVVVPVSPAS